MLKLGSSNKAIGTPVRCPSCRHPNLAIDIWCERCGRPLDWQPTQVMRPVATPPAPPEPLEAPEAPNAFQREPVHGAPFADAGRRQYCWSCGTPNGSNDQFCGNCGKELAAASAAGRRPRTWSWPKFALPAIRLPRLDLPRPRLPQWRLSQLRPPAVPRTVLVVGFILAALLLIPLAYVLFPGHRTVANRQPAATHLPITAGSQAKAASPQAVAIAAVQSKTGLKYSTSCKASTACLSMSNQTVGQGAAAIVFSTANTGGRQCVTYLVQKNGTWQLLGSVLCGLPGQLSPLVGHDATVHVPGNCANVHDRASLAGGVVTCLYDGTSVHVDGGPSYADDLMWWRISKGWLAHQFLVGP